jgi:hypothetical protein
MQYALLISGAAVYLINYIIGWLLKLEVLTLTRKFHRIIFSVLLLNLTVLLFYVNFHEANSFMLITSIFLLLLLPFGKKGGVFHILLSTAGIFIYSVFFVIELQL